MTYILRIIFSGIIATIVSMGVAELEYMKLIQPVDTGGFLEVLYTSKETIAFAVTFAIIYLTVAGPLAKRIALKLERTIKKYSVQEILMYIIGLAIGLGVATLIGSGFVYTRSNSTDVMIKAFLYLGLGYSGIYIVHIKKEEIKGWFTKNGALVVGATPKILDTSVIIDGRILDILKTNFIEGKVVIPSFVLDELRHIADSSDKLKRARGRRGLDILAEIQKIKEIPVEIVDKNYPHIEEVDIKLIKLAEELHGAVVTNDFNLNKVASLQQVVVLNINDLANAIKPVVLPNEEMTVIIVKEGKEQEQGVAYLNDGTMIVVEGGRRYVGETKQVSVTTVLQTSAGRMIFAKVVKQD
ncbi:MAG: PIN/TRAM domain-containing protein [Cellulosilyticaceae bacterium]